ncbi:MAG: hypothetical protein NWS68_01585 [Erythrobacter sp.]|nr:hypothetical protein [Erythrobacter sp.]
MNDQGRAAADKWRFPIDRRSAIVAGMAWAMIVIFLLGVGNFALNRAVFDSGHPLLARLPRSSRVLGNRAALVSEFAVLLVALMLSAKGWPGFAWAYLAYTGLNAAVAWLILNRRV